MKSRIVSAIIAVLLLPFFAVGQGQDAPIISKSQLPHICASVSTAEDCAALWQRVRPKTKDGHSWLFAAVSSVGHTKGVFGGDIPTVTLHLFDPENSNPVEQDHIWIVTADPSYGKGMRLLPEHAYLMYRDGETRSTYGFMVVWSDDMDKKGHPKAELHAIAGEL